MARQLVELGYRGSGEVVKRDEFLARKAAIEAHKNADKSAEKPLASLGKKIKDPFLLALAEREEANRAGRMTTIIFIRDKNAKNQEVSGYIDYAHRLKIEDFEPIFLGKKRMMPRLTDLSFFNWDSMVVQCQSTPNYQVITERGSGLLFKNKVDRKIISVDPLLPVPGDNTLRSIVKTPIYKQAVFYDHETRGTRG